MKIRTFFFVLALSVGLAACTGGHSSFAGSSIGGSATQAARNAGGPGSTNTRGCNVPYGDPPAELSNLTSGFGAGAIGVIANLGNICAATFAPGTATLQWTDRKGEKRGACLLVPPNASTTTKLPLVVFLQGSLVPAPEQAGILFNNWGSLYKSTNLTNDPNRPGFILLVPIGRNTHHYYPYPDNFALGWDNWYRNLDRSSPNLNVDVAAIDHFISAVEQKGIVDTNRVYLTGWSNGGAMAELYGMNTPSVAAVATYSAVGPFDAIHDPCAQKPFATTLTPIMDVHNSCDIAGTCQTSSDFHQQVRALYPALEQKVVILGNTTPLNQVVPNLVSQASGLSISDPDTLLSDVLKHADTIALSKVPINYQGDPGKVCNASCSSQTVAGDPIGIINHLVWPQNENDALFQWLRERPLSAKP